MGVPDNELLDEPVSPEDTRQPAWLRSLGIVVPAGMVGLVVAACVLLPLIYIVPEPVGGAALEASLPFLSPGHLLGTDLNGNDLLSRLIYGGRASLRIAVAVNVLGLVVGGLLGAFAAYVGGARESVIMRMFDILIAFPSLILVVAIAQAYGRSELNTIWALSFFSVPAFARIAHGATLRLRDQPFVFFATLSGMSELRVLFGHIVPNIVSQLTTFSLLGLAVAIGLEGALSFLGLGVPPPGPSWGNMIAHGQNALFTRPALVLWPSSLLFLTVLSLNLLADALRTRE